MDKPKKSYKPRKGDTIKGAEMPSIFKYVQMSGTHTLSYPPSLFSLNYNWRRKSRENSDAERAVGKSQLKRFLANPRKFRSGPAARKKK